MLVIFLDGILAGAATSKLGVACSYRIASPGRNSFAYAATDARSPQLAVFPQGRSTK